MERTENEMSIFKKLITKHVLYCKKCNHELYSYATSSSGTIFYRCINCSTYYKRSQPKEKLLIETEIPNQLNEKYFNHDENHSSYYGIPTSIEYKPKWMLWLEKVLRRKLL